MQRIPIEQLFPAPYNPRIDLSPGDPGWARLERSLEEFGLVQPIVWNQRTGHVVGGHQRLAILKHKGATDVPAIVVDLPIEREQALNVALNNAQVGGSWDNEKLFDLVSQLADLPNFDATLTGFDDEDLNDMLLAPDPHFEPLPTDQADEIEVQFAVPRDDWQAFRREFDELVGEWNIVPHVRT